MDNFFFKDLAVLLCALVAVKAQEVEDEIIIESQPAQFMPMMSPMGMGGMGMGMNPMMMSRNQFPVDYSELN